MSDEITKMLVLKEMRMKAMSIAIRAEGDYEDFMAISDLFYNYLSQGVESQFKHSIRKEYTLRELSLEMACAKGKYTNLNDLTKVAERCYKYLMRLVNSNGKSRPNHTNQ